MKTKRIDPRLGEELGSYLEYAASEAACLGHAVNFYFNGTSFWIRPVPGEVQRAK
jgi:hypothetical protein